MKQKKFKGDFQYNYNQEMGYFNEGRGSGRGDYHGHGRGRGRGRGYGDGRGRGGSYYSNAGTNQGVPGDQFSFQAPGPVQYVQVPSQGGTQGPPQGGIQYFNAGPQAGAPVPGSVFVPVANRAQGSPYGSQTSTLGGGTFGNYQGGGSSYAPRRN